MYRIIIIFFAFFISININAQGLRWKGERHSLVVSAGVSHFMGDLGGGAKDAAHFFGFRDLDFSATRPVLNVNYRYRILESFSAKVGLAWAILAADDKFSESLGRKFRNLHFKTNLFSLNLHGEYYFIKEKSSPIYKISNQQSWRNFSAYVFVGLSFNMFNPKAKLDGKWLALQPLGTEGQGIDGNPSPYKKMAIGFPIGLGVKYNFNKKMAIGIEISNTYTNSDYIDDVHDKYFDNDKIRETYGIDAARLADRHLDYDGNPHTVPKPSGNVTRGDPEYNDAFIFTLVTLTYKLKKDTRGLPKFH